MTFKDVAISTGIAGMTMAGVLVFASPAVVDAVGEGGKPGLTVDGVVFTVETVSEQQRPTARITAVNTTGEATQISGTLRLMAQSLPEPGSRMGPMSHEAWSTPKLFVLAPHETKTFEIQSAKPLPTRSLARFILKAGKQAIGTVQFQPTLMKSGTELAAVTQSPKKSKKAGKRSITTVARLMR